MPSRTISSLTALGAAHRQSLVVAVRADRVGMAGDQHLDEAVGLGRTHGFGNHFLRLVGQVRLVEVEEDDERLTPAAAAGAEAAAEAEAGAAAAAAAGRLEVPPDAEQRPTFSGRR